MDAAAHMCASWSFVITIESSRAPAVPAAAGEASRSSRAPTVAAWITDRSFDPSTTEIVALGGR